MPAGDADGSESRHRTAAGSSAPARRSSSRRRASTPDTPDPSAPGPRAIPSSAHRRSSSRPASERPAGAISFSASAACVAPTMPTSGANTPMIAQRVSSKSLTLAEQAVIAGLAAIARVEDRDLPVEADRRAGDQRLFRGDAGAVDRMAGGEVVGAVEDDIRLRDERRELAPADAPGDALDSHFRIDRGKALARRRRPWAMPTSAVSNRIWRCRLVRSTWSASTSVSVPTPAAARNCAAGLPRPPTPTISACASAKRCCASTPSSGSRMCRL